MVRSAGEISYSMSGMSDKFALSLRTNGTLSKVNNPCNLFFYENLD
jgi:hypothetical protein